MADSMSLGVASAVSAWLDQAWQVLELVWRSTLIVLMIYPEYKNLYIYIILNIYEIISDRQLF